MSIFRVKLNNKKQGTLDLGENGVQNTTSIQRTVYLTGPNKVNRKLIDGETFTDSNYYKRFAYPQAALEDAVLEVVEDDGTVWSDIAAENTFPVVFLPDTDGVIGPGLTYTDDDMSLDIAETYGGYATFIQINNFDSTATHDVLVRLNGSAVVRVEAGTSQVFNSGDITITKIEFANPTSGVVIESIQVVLSVKVVSQS